MVDNAAVTIDLILANGGEGVQPIGADDTEITARFRDPAGNVARHLSASRLTGVLGSRYPKP